ncbi:methyl-accepting chemotaxis protein [Sporolactobacillus vineae]|uniref:methyl-accepting chemotaxis protein n=1 Tax=Sporolactobacillus vineae TaxID=444463 RepID=UPI0002899FFA|nr:methyl-accepting chemotaxis protein [Sporolactobacillus vineae]
MKWIQSVTKITAKFHIRALFIPFVLAIVLIPDLVIMAFVRTDVLKLAADSGPLNSAHIASAAWLLVGKIGLIVLITLVVLAILVWLVCGAVFLQPMDHFIKSLEAIKNHDLSQVLDDSVATNREFAGMRQSLNAMAASLRKMIESISRKSETVAASSEQLTASSEENKATTDEIARSLQKVATETEEDLKRVMEAKKENDGINQSVAAITMDTLSLEATSKESVRTALSGEQAMGDATRQMREIKQTVTELSGMIDHLNRQTQDVNQIIRVINDIADQTRLLALNASIEAARAGEQGKGFSVVAEEIGKLADQSATSARQVNDILAAIRSETGQVAQSMSAGVSKVDEGMATVTRSGASFRKIEAFVTETSEKMAKVDTEVNTISKVSFKAAQAYRAMESSANETSSSTQTISAASEEQAAAAEEVAGSAASLASVADELHQLVSSFRLRNGKAL